MKIDPCTPGHTDLMLGENFHNDLTTEIYNADVYTQVNGFWGYTRCVPKCRQKLFRSGVYVATRQNTRKYTIFFKSLHKETTDPRWEEFKLSIPVSLYHYDLVHRHVGWNLKLTECFLAIKMK